MSVCFFQLFLLVVPAFAAIPTDTLFDSQWYLKKIHAPEAWDMTTGSASVIVALLDTGFDMTHPDLTGNLWVNEKEIPGNNIDDDQNGFIDDVNGYDFVDHDANPEPDPSKKFDEAAMSHGSVVAGIVGAVGNNEIGIAGINWKIRMMNVRILDNEGVGNSTTAGDGIAYAVKQGAKVINMSFTGFDHDPALQTAIKKAYDAGVVIVAAVGNTKEGGISVDEKPIYPACFGTQGLEDWVLGAAATNEMDQKALFSNYGLCVDISAPGDNMISTVYQNDAWPAFKKGFYQEGWSGTSMAAPVISGAAALLFSKYPHLTPKDVRTVLRLSVDPVFENGEAKGKMGAGRVNIASALVLAEKMFPVKVVGGYLIKRKCTASLDINDPCRAVYFYGTDGKRHAFTNDKVYFTWFADFSTIKEVTPEFLATLPLGKNVTYHPGTKLVKFQSVPTVYVVEAKGVLRAVLSESIAAQLYGSDWNKKVDDISDAFFGNYAFGLPVGSTADYNVLNAINSVTSLSQNF